jgi:hypothetical protein
MNPAVPAKDTLANGPVIRATEATVNLADNNQVKIEPGVAPSSESEASKSSRFAQSGASELRTESKQGFDKEIASAKVQSAPAAALATGADSKAKLDSVAAAAPPASQPSSGGSLAMAQRFSQQMAVQSFRNNAQASSGANVLNTFQVQQEGNEIRVLDADGSTYSGRIEQSAKKAEVDSRVAARRDLAKQKSQYQAVDENKSTSPPSYFRATGYNVTLQRRVVFEGNYEVPPPQQPTTATSNDRQRAEQSSDRARIVGTVRVNGDAPVEIDAIAETPEGTATKKNEK